MWRIILTLLAIDDSELLSHQPYIIASTFLHNRRDRPGARVVPLINANSGNRPPLLVFRLRSPDLAGLHVPRNIVNATLSSSKGYGYRSIQRYAIPSQLVVQLRLAQMIPLLPSWYYLHAAGGERYLPPAALYLRLRGVVEIPSRICCPLLSSLPTGHVLVLAIVARQSPSLITLQSRS